MQPIGVFDSGIGGLSVLKAIHAETPQIPTIYLADQIHVPYGVRSLEEVRQFSAEITSLLLSQGAGMIVVACNTASAAALHFLRMKFPEIPFVGMEPAVKPAAEATHSHVVGVLATEATFQGALYASVVERFAKDVRIMQDTLPGLVSQIEAGKLDDQSTREILNSAIQPMLASGIDTIVLGCTHFPFVIPLINEITGNRVRVIDPAPAIARQVKRLYGNLPSTDGYPSAGNRYLTSGNPLRFKQMVNMLTGVDVSPEVVDWQGSGKLNLHPQE